MFRAPPSIAAERNQSQFLHYMKEKMNVHDARSPMSQTPKACLAIIVRPLQPCTCRVKWDQHTVNILVIHYKKILKEVKEQPSFFSAMLTVLVSQLVGPPLWRVIGLVAIKVLQTHHGPQRMMSTDLSSHLLFPLAPPRGYLFILLN